MFFLNRSLFSLKREVRTGFRSFSLYRSILVFSTISWPRSLCYTQCILFVVWLGKTVGALQMIPQLSFFLCLFRHREHFLWVRRHLLPITYKCSEVSRIQVLLHPDLVQMFNKKESSIYKIINPPVSNNRIKSLDVLVSMETQDLPRMKVFYKSSRSKEINKYCRK